MREAVIVDAIRTPVGRAFKGSLVDVRPDDLLAHVFSALLDRNPTATPELIDDVIVGCGYPEREQGHNVARIALLRAGIPAKVPGTTVNRFCASSLQAIRMAFHAIACGEGDLFLCGGIESVSRVSGSARQEAAFNPALREGHYGDVYIPMGLTAECVVDRFGVTREAMDAYAQRSQERAVAAQRTGFFDREIVPVPLPDGGVVARDDGPRADSSLERLAQLPPAFREGGSVTAGNSCQLSDGAACVLVASAERAAKLGLRTRARIVASAVSGLEPSIMGMGPVEAVRRVLRRAGMSIGDIEVVELNEAFAAQVLPVAEQLGIDESMLNPHGGAIALGHPFGMTGARIMTTLLNDLQTLDRSVGLETMCVGGGQGMAMVVERLS